MQYTAKELAKMVKGTVEGDENVRVWKPCKIEEGCEGGITFLGNPKYTHYVYEQQASIVIVRKDFVPEQPIPSTLIRVDNPYLAVAYLLHAFNERSKPPRGRSCRSHVGRGSKLGKRCYMGPYSFVGRHTVVGNDVKIYPNAYIGDNCKIGDGTIIYAGVKIYEGVEIGRNCIIHAGAVIGADGFGFAPADDGTWNKIDQIGNVILEDNVEVGANTCIDRASIGSTILHEGVKVDNLCQLAHNVVIGKNTAMASQVGIAGSCHVGEHTIIAGQAGLVGHITVGDNVTIGAQSGVTHAIPSNQSVFGSPAMEASKRRKLEVYIRNLEKLTQRVEKLEKHES
ncbi:MAG: UDP-3-O-(3-hydroxymyristoyl)glucosamine N-acyltransferase [Bacteroidales bacterium]|nr:UDP-3-O-(3-hydroxymyristoyl)glucosamine N-acyltransferase [Bacteroidales bacterium]